MMLIIKNLEEIVQVCSKGESFKSGKEQDEVALIKRKGNSPTGKKETSPIGKKETSPTQEKETSPIGKKETSSSPSIGCFIAVDWNGRIGAIGHDDDEYLHHLAGDERTVIIDGKGHSIIPGFIDSHTHPVWSGDRLFEFDLKMSKPGKSDSKMSKPGNFDSKMSKPGKSDSKMSKPGNRPTSESDEPETKGGSQVEKSDLVPTGNTYLDIHKSGGGIYFTVNCTTESSETELSDLLSSRIENFISCGTTTLEVKTGYGLEAETELKQLAVIERAKKAFKGRIEIVTTLLPAHAVPKGMDAEEGTRHVIRMLDVISERLTGSDIKIDFIDAFCEKGVYEVDQCRRIFEHAQKLFPSTMIGFHGEELSNLDSPAMAASLSARHVSHLEHVSTHGLKAMAKSGVAAVLLPTTAYLLRLSPPPVREMIDKYGVIVALGSDFNPNAYCYSMAHVMLHGVIYYRMTLNEALVASTINSAFALGRSKEAGSIEVGKSADFILLKSNDWKRIIYQMGESKDLIQAVVKAGNLVKGSFPN